jgi:hypothetical protein
MKSVPLEGGRITYTILAYLNKPKAQEEKTHVDPIAAD